MPKTKLKKSSLLKKLLIGVSAIIVIALAVSSYFLVRYGIGPLTYFTIVKPKVSSINVVGSSLGGDRWYEGPQIKNVVVDKSTPKGTTRLTYTDDQNVTRIITTTTSDAGTHTEVVNNGTVEVKRDTTETKGADGSTNSKTTDVRTNADGTKSEFVTTKTYTSATQWTETTTKDGKTYGTIVVDNGIVKQNDYPNTAITDSNTPSLGNNTCATLGSPVREGTWVATGAIGTGGDTTRACVRCGASGYDTKNIKNCGDLFMGIGLGTGESVVLPPDADYQYTNLPPGTKANSCFSNDGGNWVQVGFGGTSSKGRCGAGGTWITDQAYNDLIKAICTDPTKCKLKPIAPPSPADQIAQEKQAYLDAKGKCENDGVGHYIGGQCISLTAFTQLQKSCIGGTSLDVVSGKCTGGPTLTSSADGAVKCHAQHPGYLFGKDFSGADACVPNTPTNQAMINRSSPCKSGKSTLGGVPVIVECGNTGAPSYKFCTGGSFDNSGNCVPNNAPNQANAPIIVNPNGQVGGLAPRASLCKYKPTSSESLAYVNCPNEPAPVSNLSAPANPTIPSVNIPSGPCPLQPGPKSCATVCGGMTEYTIDTTGVMGRCKHPTPPLPSSTTTPPESPASSVQVPLVPLASNNVTPPTDTKPILNLNYQVTKQNGVNSPLPGTNGTLTDNVRGCVPYTAYNLAKYLGYDVTLNTVKAYTVWGKGPSGYGTNGDAAAKDLQLIDPVTFANAYSKYDVGRIDKDANQLKTYTGALIYSGHVGDVAHVAGFVCNKGDCIALDSYFGDGKPAKCTIESSSSVKCGDYSYKVGDSGGGPDSFHIVPGTENLVGGTQ